jgi:PAS domain S-box-containing protein
MPLFLQTSDSKPAKGTLDSPGQLLLLGVLVGTACYLATKLAFALCLSDSKVCLIFPPYALLIAVLLTVPVRLWWVCVLAAMCGHVAATWPRQWTFWFTLHSEVFDATKYLLAAIGIRLLTKGPLTFATLREAVVIVGVAVIVVPFGTALWGAGLGISHGFGTHYWIEWRNVGLSNAATALALLPGLILVLAKFRNGRRPIIWERFFEGALLAIGLLATSMMAFAIPGPGSQSLPEFFCAPVPLLVWAALRFGPGGTTASLLLVWAIAIWGAMHGRGPFLAHSSAQNTLSLQYFFLFNSIPLTFLSVLIEEEGKSRAALRENEARFRAVTNTAPVMIWKSGADKRCTFFNDGWLDFTGRSLEQEKGDGWSEGVHPEDLDHCLQIYGSSFDARQDFTMEYRLRRKDGEYRWILDSGVPLFDPPGTFQGYIGSCVDITDSKRAARELQVHRNEVAHLARVTVLGELSGSITHELGQPLTAILTNAQAALRFLTQEPADIRNVREILVDIVDDDRRAADVIHRLRELFTKGEVQSKSLDLNEVIEDVLKLLHGDLLNQHVVVDRELAETLPAVRGDRVQMQQVIINLIVNACDAMSDTESSKRRLSVRTESRDGDGVRAAVGDQGCGIAPDQLERVFEPFVTTKSKGMGLGLAVCRTIIAAHGGALWAENNPEAGACFVITLPTQNGPAHTVPVAQPSTVA